VIETLLQDVRYGARALRKAPGFTAAASLTLALGIAANTAVFSVVDAVLVRPLPYSAPERLVSVTGTYPNGAFAEMRRQIRTMEVAAFADGHSFNLIGVGEAVRISGTRVSAELFSLLGIHAARGRTFETGEDTAGRDQVVILSHALWQQRFGGDADIIGRSIELEGVRRQIVGVMPADFRFPSAKTQLWIPLDHDPRDAVNSWAGDYMPVIGRVRPGSTMDEARVEIRLFQSRVLSLFPWQMPASWNADVTVIPLQRDLVSDARSRLIILFGAVAIILLIACANVANLTLARAATREREIATRAALGAGSRRIARQLLTESGLLACLGGLLGVALAVEASALLKFIVPEDTPRLADVTMNWRVLVFSGATALLAGCLFGFAPVIHARRSGLTRVLESGGRGAVRSVSQRLRSALTVAQIALAVLLVIAAGLLARSLGALSSVDPGFQPEKVITARINPNASVCREAERCLAFYRQLEDQARALPGAIGVALVGTPPLGGTVTKRNIEIDVPTVRPPLFWLNVVTADYFRVMNIAVHSGRGFTAADLSGGPPVAAVAEQAARHFWPGDTPVGKRIRFAGEQEWRTVVGVVSDVRAYDLTRDVPGFIAGTVYVPYTVKATHEDGRIPAEMTMVVRTGSDPARFGGALRGLVAGLNREVVVSDVKTMSDYLAESIATPVSTASLFIMFAGLALLLGSIGVYGVLAFLVSKRTREIGVRLALGAQAGDIAWLIMKEGIKVGVAGIVCGVGGAIALSRALSSELHGISPLDPMTYGGVVFVVAAVTLVACYVPARRAMRVDPMVAMRD
jgi:putative ABC transport system permease protein